jgi:hypothetical protein
VVGDHPRYGGHGTPVPFTDPPYDPGLRDGQLSPDATGVAARRSRRRRAITYWWNHDRSADRIRIDGSGSSGALSREAS